MAARSSPVKAVLNDAPKRFAVTELPSPKPGAGEVLISPHLGAGRDAEVTRLLAIIHPTHPGRS